MKAYTNIFRVPLLVTFGTIKPYIKNCGKYITLIITIWFAARARFRGCYIRPRVKEGFVTALRQLVRLKQPEASISEHRRLKHVTHTSTEMAAVFDVMPFSLSQ
jgi:hypothetical protein